MYHYPNEARYNQPISKSAELNIILVISKKKTDK